MSSHPHSWKPAWRHLPGFLILFKLLHHLFRLFEFPEDAVDVGVILPRTFGDPRLLAEAETFRMGPFVRSHGPLCPFLRRGGINPLRLNRQPLLPLKQGVNQEFFATRQGPL